MTESICPSSESSPKNYVFCCCCTFSLDKKVWTFLSLLIKCFSFGWQIKWFVTEYNKFCLYKKKRREDLRLFALLDVKTWLVTLHFCYINCILTRWKPKIIDKMLGKWTDEILWPEKSFSHQLTCSNFFCLASQSSVAVTK